MQATLILCKAMPIRAESEVVIVFLEVLQCSIFRNQAKSYSAIYHVRDLLLCGEHGVLLYCLASDAATRQAVYRFG
jgi:hypothetical protein